MTQSYKMALSIARNRNRGCEVYGCLNHAHGFGAFCTKHHMRRQRFGHPEARPVTRRDLRPYRAAVAAFLRDNESHTAVAAAREFFQTLLDTSRLTTTGHVKSSQKLAHHLAYAKSQGTDGTQLLTEALAVSALAEDQPRRFKDDQHRLFVLARRILQVSPLCRYGVCGGRPVYVYAAMGPTILRELSRLIQGRMARFLIVAGQEVIKRMGLSTRPIEVTEPFSSNSPKQQVSPTP